MTSSSPQTPDSNDSLADTPILNEDAIDVADEDVVATAGVDSDDVVEAEIDIVAAEANVDADEDVPPAPMLPEDDDKDDDVDDDDKPWGEPSPVWVQRMVLGVCIGAIVLAVALIIWG